MAIPDPPKAGSPFSPLQTGGWNPKTPEINNFFIPEITLRRGYELHATLHAPRVRVRRAWAIEWGGAEESGFALCILIYWSRFD